MEAPKKRKFRIVRIVTEETFHEAYSKETIEELLEMSAPFSWQVLPDQTAVMIEDQGEVK